MSDRTLTQGWPGAPAFSLLRLRDGAVQVVASAGEQDERRAWASVSKMAVALAVGIEVDWGLHHYDEVLGPCGATLAQLVSHSSGLGLEETDPVAAPGAKRVYSNYGVDLAVGRITDTPAQWLDARVFQPLGLHDTRLEGRPAAGVVGTTRDLTELAAAWLRPDAVARPTRDRMITPFLAALDGVVPGFGRFTPCPWGLGPEVRGEKQHWMGDWPATSFGHFGQSGSMLLANADEGIALVATSTVPFAAWAVELWPRWTSFLRRVALAS